MDVLELRLAVEEAAGRFSRELREELVAAVHELFAQGDSMADIGELLGISATTVSRYLDRRPSTTADDVADATLIAVTAPSAITPASRSVVMPSGVRIEGLSLDEAIAAARALS